MVPKLTKHIVIHVSKKGKEYLTLRNNLHRTDYLKE